MNPNRSTKPEQCARGGRDGSDDHESRTHQARVSHERSMSQHTVALA